MTQSKPQPANVLISPSAIVPRGFAASMASLRTVALSLLVDRALSA
jgi:hypothetical protein